MNVEYMNMLLLYRRNTIDKRISWSIGTYGDLKGKGRES